MARHRYPFESIEPKWQARWDEEKTFAIPNPGDPEFDAKKPKFYALGHVSLSEWIRIARGASGGIHGD